MLRTDNEVRITPSVLDRLLDYEPELSREPVTSRAKSLRQLKQSVKRDLEWLLNTRRTAEVVPPELKELNDSLAVFGLPDFTTASVKNTSDQKMMRRALETAIRVFEPRLEDLVVTLEPMDSIERVMRFRIEARLKVEPAPEPITFDTVLQLGSGQILVQEK
ncbi:MAG: type VI secretion system baseplate subunit TssE [Pyrinomonadaceae bacterium]|nr:type VI secretion system baseplate subunit TssE [Pyrinomonadaceae bacterium]